MKLLVPCTALLLVAAGVASVAVGKESGKTLYEAKCAMCHSKDGTPKAPAKGARDFKDAAFQKEATVASISAVIADGKGKMPPLRSRMNADEIKAVAEYVKTLKPAK